MATVNVRVRYRPVRIGWCIRDQNWDDLRRALRLTHVLWGGKFNPIVPVAARAAGELVRRFRVDVLLDVVDDPEIKAFVDGFKHLPWPLLRPALFSDSFFGELLCNFLDVSHPLAKIADKERGRLSLDASEEAFIPGPRRSAVVHWESGDPLEDVLLATFGAYPDAKEVGRDYEQLVAETIWPDHHLARQGQALPASLLDQITPSTVSALDLNWDRIPYHAAAGFYAGKASEFEDIVNYWNLQACGLNVLFLDPDHSERLRLLRESHSRFLTERRIEDRHHGGSVPVWSRSQEVVKQLAFPDAMVPFYNGLDSIDPLAGIRPALHFFNTRTVLGSISEKYGGLSAAFQLPEKPFRLLDDWSTEHFVVSITNPIGADDGTNTFWTPYVTDLNQWYGRAVFSTARGARVEADGIGVICPITDESLEFESTRKQELATKVFELAGIEAKPSLPGRVASRLISQFGGLQGCRVLKIRGVRRLIREHSPLQDFDRTEAMRTIGDCDPVTGQPRFSDYEGLFIEQRDPSIDKLKPEHAFLYLLEKGVFRVGMKLVCPACELPSWVDLDSLSTTVSCELCGSAFNTTRQLKDRAWAYRRSGLFGRENNQEGSIPVALTLQQLDTHIRHSSGSSLLLTNVSLLPAGANMQPCGTDIFIAVPDGDRIQIAIGECKDAGGKMELDDARKLSAVADSFPRGKFDVYIVFSKTAPFTDEEVRSCREAQHKGGGRRVIMLSDRELEPYSLYERTAQQFEVRQFASSLQDMAQVTHDVFFVPRPKA